MAGVRVDAEKLRIESDSLSYEDTIDNAILHSGGVFEALPDTIVRYQLRSSGVEYWVVELADDAGLSQEAPSEAYKTMIRDTLDILQEMIAAQTEGQGG